MLTSLLVMVTYQRGNPANCPLVYRGAFKNNVINGYGELVYECNDRSFKYTTDSINDNRRIYEFKGTFVDGVPKEGLYIADFNSKGLPTTFYSGEVMLTGTFETSIMDKITTYATDLIWHGYGTVFKPEVNTDYLGRVEGFYLGQFYKGSATGFALYNTPLATEVYNLEVGLVLADKVVKTLAVSNTGVDYLLDRDITPAQYGKKIFSQLPLMDSITKASFQIDENTSYQGAVYNGKPYGPGLVKYDDGFMDIGFWLNGRKIHARQLLASVLPDSTVLQPKYVTELSRTFKAAKPKASDQKAYRSGIGDGFKLWWERDKRKVAYYASFNGLESPVGWGWKVAVDDDEAEPEAGKFNGSLSSKKNRNNADTMFLSAHPELRKATYWNIANLANGFVENAEQRFYFSSWRKSKTYIPLDKDDNPILEGYKKQPTPDFLKSIAFSDGNYARVASVEANKASIEKARSIGWTLYSYPVINPTKLVLYKSDMTKSYLTDGVKEYKLRIMTGNDLKVNDCVLHDEKLKRVIRSPYDVVLLEDNSSLPPPSSTVYVIRGHRILKTTNTWTCPACKGAGGTTATVGTQAKIGTETKVTSISGNTATITTTPVYTQLPGFTIKVKCPECKGFPMKTVPHLQVEYR